MQNVNTQRVHIQGSASEIVGYQERDSFWLAKVLSVYTSQFIDILIVLSIGTATHLIFYENFFS